MSIFLDEFGDFRLGERPAAKNDNLSLLPKKGASAVGRARHPGLMADASGLGVHYSHLYRVLSGQRKSRRLLAAYRGLKAGQGNGQ